MLIDFHSQDEKHSLMDPDKHLSILDNEIPDIEPLLEKTSSLYKDIKELKSKIEAMNLSDAER